MLHCDCSQRLMMIARMPLFLYCVCEEAKGFLTKKVQVSDDASREASRLLVLVIVFGSV